MMLKMTNPNVAPVSLLQVEELTWHEEAKRNIHRNKNEKPSISRKATRSAARARRRQNDGHGRPSTNQTREVRRAAAVGARRAANPARVRADAKAAGKRRDAKGSLGGTCGCRARTNWSWLDLRPTVEVRGRNPARGREADRATREARGKSRAPPIWIAAAAALPRLPIIFAAVARRKAGGAGSSNCAAPVRLFCSKSKAARQRRTPKRGGHVQPISRPPPEGLAVASFRFGLPRWFAALEF